MDANHGGPRRLTLALPAETYAILAELADVRGVPVEALAAAVLTGAVVRCTVEEHGPDLAGKVLARAELDARELLQLQMQRDAARVELDEVCGEIRHLAHRLARLADGGR